MIPCYLVHNMRAETHNWAARWGGWRIRDDVFEWLRDNVTEWSVWEDGTFYFERQQDALLFKLTWGGQ